MKFRKSLVVIEMFSLIYIVGLVSYFFIAKTSFRYTIMYGNLDDVQFFGLGITVLLVIDGFLAFVLYFYSDGAW